MNQSYNTHGIGTLSESMGGIHVPRLDSRSSSRNASLANGYSQHHASHSHQNTTANPLADMTMTEQKGDSVLYFIKNLERFCNEIAENKLLWTPEVLTFFGIKDGLILRDLEKARESFQKK